MSLPCEAIKAQQTYCSIGGTNWYVQDLQDKMVTAVKVGEPARYQISLGRFADRMSHEVPNQ